MRNKPQQFSNSTVEKWAYLYESGKSSSHIAKLYNTASNTVIRNLRKADVTIRTKSETKIGNLNPMWKGDNVKYYPLHRWVERWLSKPEYCQNCGTAQPYDLANISGEYHRDLNDWKWLCRKCHMIEDGRLEKLIEFNRKKN